MEISNGYNHKSTSIIYPYFSPLLSVETLTYLIFEGVNFCEEFELALREHRTDLKPHLRRLHLLVTALHEFIETLKTYSQSTHFTKEVREPILKVVHAVSSRLCC